MQAGETPYYHLVIARAAEIKRALAEEPFPFRDGGYRLSR